jgi:hypothetical protein
MKTLLVAVLVTLSSLAHADAATDHDARLLAELVGVQPVRPAAEVARLHRRGHEKRVAGHVTLGLSLAMVTAGLVAEGWFIAQDVGSGLGDCGPSCAPDNGLGKAIAGAAIGVGALGAIAGGIVLKMGVDEGRQGLELSLAPQASASSGGMWLRARF